MAVTWTTQRSGNWSLISSNASSPWYDGGTQTAAARTPGSSGNANADLVVIANGHTLTCDASVTVGDTANVNTNYAVATAGTGGTGILNVNGGVTLTVVSRVKQGNATWTFSAGAGLVFGNTSAQSQWMVGDTSDLANCKVVFSGSSGSHCTISATTTGNGRFYSTQNLAQFDILYTDVTGIGESTNPAFQGQVYALTVGMIKFRNCTFTSCGSNYLSTAGNPVGGSTIVVDSCTWTGTVASTCLQFPGSGVAITTGTRTINNCSFDKQMGASGQYMKDFTITGNYFGGGYNCGNSASYPWAQFSGNFVPVTNTSATYVNGSTVYTNPWNYWHIHSSAGALNNVHMFNWAPQLTSVELSGNILDPGNTDYLGDLILPPTPTGGASTLTVRYNLVLPVGAGTSAGKSIGELLSFVNDTTNLTTTCDHNTIPSVGSGAGTETGLTHYGETYKGRIGMVASCRSNLVWTPSGQTAGVKVQKTATTSAAGTASATNGSTAVTGSSTTWNTAGTGKLIAGDWIRFGSETVAYQIASVASDTSLTLSSNYGGTTGSGKTWQPYVKDAIYNAGFTAADYNAGWGLAAGTDGKGYNSDLTGSTLFSYTPGPNDVALSASPFVDSTRNIATWAVAVGAPKLVADGGDGVTGVTSGDTYQVKVNAARAHMAGSPSTRVAALTAWVQAGWSVKDSSLKNAGHDSATVGALPYSALGTVPILGIISGGRVA